MDFTISKDPKEFISPEGVEERVIDHHEFHITLTGGGKYRTYATFKGQNMPGRVFNSIEEARKGMGMDMLMLGSLEVDPIKTINSVVAGLKRDGAK